MKLKKMDHTAFITNNMVATIRFYRDLLGMRLVAGVGHEGFRHYFFQVGDGCVAFFEYPIAKPMKYDKFHGTPTDLPIGFDHIAFTVDSKEDLFEMKDRLEAAGIAVHGAVDHGIFWSMYFFDPVNNLPLECAWNCVELTGAPAMYEEVPLAIVAEGADPQPGHWPEPTRRTPPEEMVATGGNGLPMRQAIIQAGKGHITRAGRAAGITADVQN
jgi:catechol 2,3-dioxygenase-like lactoylglutathione lyase family enzyme